MPPKPKLLDVWDPGFFEITERTLDGTPTKAKCRCVSCVAMYVLILIVHRLCSEWQQVANATRIAVAAITPSHAIAQNAICNLHYTNGQWHAIVKAHTSWP